MATLVCPNCFYRPAAREFDLCVQCYNNPIIRDAWRDLIKKRKQRLSKQDITKVQETNYGSQADTNQ